MVTITSNDEHVKTLTSKVIRANYSANVPRIVLYSLGVRRGDALRWRIHEDTDGTWVELEPVM